MNNTKVHSLFITCSLFLVASLAISAEANARARAKKQSFVLIVVDDLGYMDIGAYNPKSFYDTPNVDALAKS